MRSEHQSAHSPRDRQPQHPSQKLTGCGYWTTIIHNDERTNERTNERNFCATKPTVLYVVHVALQPVAVGVEAGWRRGMLTCTYIDYLSQSVSQSVSLVCCTGAGRLHEINPRFRSYLKFNRIDRNLQTTLLWRPHTVTVEVDLNQFA